MQGSKLPPPHPSLPRQPVIYQMPHGYNIPSYYNSHYVQAYSQASASTSVVKNVSSSLTGQNSRAPISNSSSHLVDNGYASGASKTSFLDSKSFWYQPGNNRCNHQGCTFFGSHKSVEIHMMDRHLIYPPGWEKRKKKLDWDADPSLKGYSCLFFFFQFTNVLCIPFLYRKPIPIQGTNIILDSPEILDAWIAERKKRFPTSARIEDKKRKLEEAVARGQLDITGATLRPNKRQKYDRRFDDRGSHHTMQSCSGKIGKDQTRTTDSGWGGRVRAAPVAPSRVIVTIEASHSRSSSEDDTDREPEILSSKIQHASEIPVVQEDKDLQTKGSKTSDPSQSIGKNDTMIRHRSFALQPKNPPMNPFVSRSTLLRNVSHSALSSFASPIHLHFSCSYQKYV